MPARKPRLSRQARNIKVRGDFPGEPLEVYTRLSKREYEARREIFDDSPPDHLASFYYDEWVEMGARGGRPRKWPAEKIRKKIERAKKKAQAKLDQGSPLTKPERGLLGLIKPRPGARKYHLDRESSPKERQRARRARLKGGPT